MVTRGVDDRLEHSRVSLASTSDTNFRLGWYVQANYKQR